MDQRERFITPLCGNHFRRVVRDAFTYAAWLVGGDAKDGLLVTLTAMQVVPELCAALRPVLGETGVQNLLNSGRVSGETRVQLITDLTMHDHTAWRGPVLMICPYPKMLRHVGSMRGVTAEVVVPSVIDETIGAWIELWKPTPILDERPECA